MAINILKLFQRNKRNAQKNDTRVNSHIQRTKNGYLKNIKSLISIFFRIYKYVYHTFLNAPPIFIAPQDKKPIPIGLGMSIVSVY